MLSPASFPLVKYVLMAAVRDKMVIALLVLILLGCSLAMFLGSSAVTEQDRFSVVFAAGGLRIMGVLGLVLFVIFFVRRSFDSKDIEFLLSRPVGRLQFVLSYALAVSILSVILSAAIGVAVYALSPHLFGEGHLLWIASIMVENIIMVNTALFFAMYISSAASASMVTLAFYVLARMMGQFLGIVDSSLVDGYGPMAMTVQLVSVLMPRLDLMAQTSWLLYGYDNAVSLITVMIQGLVFVFLVLSAAMLDFVQRQF